MKKKGFVSIVLHAHLPYVHHPEHDVFFEENWLFEAITECYIPLIIVMDRLHNDQVNFNLTVSLSPTLIMMFRDDLLQTRYQAHLDRLIELAEKEVVRTRYQPECQKLSRLYRRNFLNIRKVYQHYQGNLLNAFKKHQAAGHLELITSAATHGFLPLLNITETAVRQQVELGIETFESNLGLKTAGFWLPECGYYQGLENILKKSGINYFYTDTHAVTEASEMADYSVYEPLDCGNGVLAFAREPEATQQVWNAEKGYPQNSNYREYYRDIGFELDLDYIGPYILDGLQRINTGIKYHHIRSEEQATDYYDLRKAQQQIEYDASDFVEQCRHRIERLRKEMDKPPIIVAPYDAELFGHWWFEGPCWLEHVLRLADEPENNFITGSCKEYMQLQTEYKTALPMPSTWGDEGYSNYWINEENDWIYPFIHQATEEMEKLTLDFKGLTVTPLQRRALNQALRSLLLAQASDWPFIMKSGTTTEYAKKRITDHLARFNYLNECIRKNRIDEHYLLALEIMDNIFPDIDFRKFQ